MRKNRIIKSKIINHNQSQIIKQATKSPQKQAQLQLIEISSAPQLETEDLVQAMKKTYMALSIDKFQDQSNDFNSKNKQLQTTMPMRDHKKLYAKSKFSKKKQLHKHKQFVTPKIDTQGDELNKDLIGNTVFVGKLRPFSNFTQTNFYESSYISYTQESNKILSNYDKNGSFFRQKIKHPKLKQVPKTRLLTKNELVKLSANKLSISDMNKMERIFSKSLIKECPNEGIFVKLRQMNKKLNVLNLNFSSK